MTCLFAVTLASTTTQESTYSLDLVNAPITTDAEFQVIALSGRLLTGALHRGFAEGASTPTLPLTVTLISLDRGTYSVGDEMTYEFVVSNSGSQSVYVPTSRQGHLVTVEMPHATRSIFNLTFDDDLLGTQRIAGQPTFGSAPVANSLLLLQPNESVRIRARERLGVQTSAGTPDWWLRTVNIRVQFGLYPFIGEPHGEVTSLNSIAIQISNSP